MKKILYCFFVFVLSDGSYIQEENGVPYLRGIVSSVVNGPAASPLGPNVNAGEYFVMTDITKYTDWIDSIISVKHPKKF